MEFWRFTKASDPGTVLLGSYDLLLAVMSVLVASLASFVALAVIHRVLVTRSEQAKRNWLASGAVALGGGIWAMHFTAMLAFSLPVAMSYSLSGTTLSVIPALVGSAVALRVMSRESIEWRRLHVGGLSLALGIGTMHYVGMEAVRADAIMRYDPALFVLSILVAYLLGTAALYVRFFFLRGTGGSWRIKVPSALLMGCSVSGMHYTAMAAVRFYPAPVSSAPVMVLPPMTMALTILLFVSLLLGLALVGTVVDERLTDAGDSVLESATRHQALLETMADGFLTVDAFGHVQSMNLAAEQMFGYETAEVRGRPAAILVRIPGWEHAAEGTGVSADRLEQLLLGSEEVGGCRKNGESFPAELRASRVEIGGKVVFSLSIRDVGVRKAAEMEFHRLAIAVDQAHEVIMVLDTDRTIRYVNPAFCRTSGYEREEVLGKTPMLLANYDDSHYGDVWEVLGRGEVWTGRFTDRRKDGTRCETEATISPVRDEDGTVTNFVQVSRDVTEQLTLETQLGQAQKLEAIGQLAAGIAHEINTPTQYVGDNTRFLKDAFTDLLGLVGKLTELADVAREGDVPDEMFSEIDSTAKDADIEYLIEEIPRAIEQSLEGVERVTKIVRAMKEFSHPSVEKTATDLNAAIQSTTTVATNEWKYVADLVTDFDESLPPVPVVPGEFNQVILNMIVNAAHAIADVVGDGSTGKGTITVRSRLCGEWAEIVLEDTGKGMPPEVRDRIFDPFFTTKEVGKGTGQGLSIAHSVVTQKHGGTVSVDSVPGEGTTFVIRLPLVDPADQEPRGEVQREAAA